MPGAELILQGVQPVETHEVVEAAAALLAGDAAFMAHVGHAPDGQTAGTLHVHRVALDQPGPVGSSDGGPTEAEAVPLYALLREMAGVGAVSGASTPDGLLTVRMQLQLSVDPGATTRPDRVLARGHVLAWRALEGALLAAGEGEGAFVSSARVTRADEPTPARPDGSGRLYSSAYYAAAVRPVQP